MDLSLGTRRDITKKYSTEGPWLRFPGGGPGTGQHAAHPGFRRRLLGNGCVDLQPCYRTGPDGQWRPHVTATAHTLSDHWWAVVTSAFWARNLTAYVLGASLGFLDLAQGLLGSWTREMGSHLLTGPSAFIIGAAMAGTASMATLWRRRIRLAVFALLLLLALPTGGFADRVRLGASGAGTVLGSLPLGRRPRFGRLVSSRHEGRVLLSLLIAKLRRAAHPALALIIRT